MHSCHLLKVWHPLGDGNLQSSERIQRSLLCHTYSDRLLTEEMWQQYYCAPVQLSGENILQVWPQSASLRSGEQAQYWSCPAVMTANMTININHTPYGDGEHTEVAYAGKKLNISVRKLNLSHTTDTSLQLMLCKKAHYRKKTNALHITNVIIYLYHWSSSRTFMTPNVSGIPHLASWSSKWS
jgi:hypothetical protein